MTNCLRAGAPAWFNYPFLTEKERDVETGLDYFLARYYSSAQGRFTSPDEFKGGPEELFADVDPHDPFFYANTAEPQSLNKYHYALNNPLRYIDPDGHQTATADALKLGATLTIAGPHPVVKVVGVAILVGVAVEVLLAGRMSVTSSRKHSADLDQDALPVALCVAQVKHLTLTFSTSKTVRRVLTHNKVHAEVYARMALILTLGNGE